LLLYRCFSIALPVSWVIFVNSLLLMIYQVEGPLWVVSSRSLSKLEHLFLEDLSKIRTNAAARPMQIYCVAFQDTRLRGMTNISSFRRKPESILTCHGRPVESPTGFPINFPRRFRYGYRRSDVSVKPGMTNS